MSQHHVSITGQHHCEHPVACLCCCCSSTSSEVIRFAVALLLFLLIALPAGDCDAAPVKWTMIAAAAAMCCRHWPQLVVLLINPQGHQQAAAGCRQAAPGETATGGHRGGVAPFQVVSMHQLCCSWLKLSLQLSPATMQDRIAAAATGVASCSHQHPQLVLLLLVLAIRLVTAACVV